MKEKKGLDGYKVVRVEWEYAVRKMKVQFWSAYITSKGEMRYYLDRVTNQRRGQGAMVVFKSLIEARIFAQKQEDIYEKKYIIFACKYVSSHAKRVWLKRRYIRPLGDENSIYIEAVPIGGLPPSTALAKKVLLVGKPLALYADDSSYKLIRDRVLEMCHED